MDDYCIKWTTIGVLLNSALYLAGVFVAGLVMGNPYAWKFSLCSAGITYLSYLAGLNAIPRWIVMLLVCSSIAAGTVAGLALLVRD